MLLCPRADKEVRSGARAFPSTGFLPMHTLRRLLGMAAEKKDLGHLPLAARVYILAVIAVALAVAGYSAGGWRTVHMGQFLLYLAGGILCSNLKVGLPGVTSTLSVNYLFILAAVTDLTLAQTVVIGCVTGVAQLVLKARKRPRGVQSEERRVGK